MGVMIDAVQEAPSSQVEVHLIPCRQRQSGMKGCGQRFVQTISIRHALADRVPSKEDGQGHGEQVLVPREGEMVGAVDGGSKNSRLAIHGPAFVQFLYVPRYDGIGKVVRRAPLHIKVNRTRLDVRVADPTLESCQ